VSGFPWCAGADGAEHPSSIMEIVSQRTACTERIAFCDGGADLLRSRGPSGVNTGESALVSRTATTDDRLTELYRAYGPVIYSRCRRMLGDHAAAEDATQETFMRVYRHIDKADPRQALGWIYRIATNYCLNEIRNRKRRAEQTDQEPDELLGIDLASLLADRDLVARIVHRAPEKLRAVAWLHHVDGLDQAEVARVLEISRRTVVSRLTEFAESARKFVHRGAA
jgi:RNA polymerase sigma-70 factor (ECF subfamily)